MADFDAANFTPEGGSIAGDPTAVAAGAGGSGLNWMSLISMLGGLGKATAPARYNRWGGKIPTWQENVGGLTQQLSQAQIMAKALGAPSSGVTGTSQMNPMQMMLMMQMMNKPLTMGTMGGQ
jgi:hypothetical protein